MPHRAIDRAPSGPDSDDTPREADLLLRDLCTYDRLLFPLEPRRIRLALPYPSIGMTRLLLNIPRLTTLALCGHLCSCCGRCVCPASDVGMPMDAATQSSAQRWVLHSVRQRRY